jgi:hypothetical protein
VRQGLRPSDDETTDIHVLRQILHIAIDKMPFEDLLGIRVPAGLLLEIERQRRA